MNNALVERCLVRSETAILASGKLPFHRNAMTRDSFVIPQGVFGGNGVNLIDVCRSVATEFIKRDDFVINVTGGLTYALKNGKPEWERIGDIDLGIYFPDDLSFSGIKGYYSTFEDCVDQGRAIHNALYNALISHGLKASLMIEDPMWEDINTYLNSSRSYRIHLESLKMGLLSSMDVFRTESHVSYNPFAYYDRPELISHITDRIQLDDMVGHFIKKYGSHYKSYAAGQSGEVTSDLFSLTLDMSSHELGCLQSDISMKMAVLRHLASMHRLRGNYSKADEAYNYYIQSFPYAFRLSHMDYAQTADERAEFCARCVEMAEQINSGNGVNPTVVGESMLRAEINARLWSHYLQEQLSPDDVKYLSGKR